MSLTQKVAQNTIIQIIGKAVSTVIGLIVVAMLARYLGKEGYGNYTTAITYLQFFLILVDLGLYLITVREISKEGQDQQKIISNIFTLRLTSAVLFLALASIIAWFINYPLVVKLGIVVTTFSFLSISLVTVLTGIFQKHLRLDKVVIGENVGRLVLLVGTALAIYLHQGVITLLLAVSLGSIFNFLTIFFYSRKYLKISLCFDWPIWKYLLKESAPLAFSVVLNVLYFKADTLILSWIRPQSEVGIYGMPYKILEILLTFPAMFAGLLLPVLAEAYLKRDQEKFRRVLQKGYDFMVMTALPLIVGTVFLAQPVIELITRSRITEFADAAPLLRILIVATGIIFIGNLFGNAVVAINKQRQMVWAYLGVAIFALTTYFIFIPKYSYWAAAIITVITELAIMISASLLVYFTTRFYPKIQMLLKVVGASVAMGLVLYLLSDLNLFLLIIISCSVYLGVLYLLRGFNKELIKEIINFKKS